METIGELESAGLVAHSHNVNGIELYRDVAEDDNFQVVIFVYMIIFC